MLLCLLVARRRVGPTAVALATALALVPDAAPCAQATTGTIVGHVTSSVASAPVAGATIDAASPSGRFHALSDAHGRFTIVGVPPDTYRVSVTATGFEPGTLGGVTVLPGVQSAADIALAPVLREIGRVVTHAAPGGTTIGDTQDIYRVVGAQARGPATAAGAGLGPYTANSVQGAVAAVPGVQQDQFANVILQGGKVEDTVFSYDGVPVPQALIAEPGGNVIGAQLPTTGLGYVTVQTGGLSTSSNQALSGVIDEIPATGVYPGVASVDLEQGILPGSQRAEVESRWATPDLRVRYALDAEIGNNAFAFGDGTSFYPAEAGTYGVAIAANSTWSLAGNVHVRLGARDDVSFVALTGQETYDQYGTPFAGLTYGLLSRAGTPFPGGEPADAPVTSATGIRGQYAVLQLADLRVYDHATARLEVYQSQFTSRSSGPFWDDLSFPDGPISFVGVQGGNLYGIGLDVQNVASERHTLSYGAEARTQASLVDDIVPTQNDVLSSAPVLNSYLAYLSDRYSPSSRLSVSGTARLNATHVLRSDGNSFGETSLDPHLGANYKLAGEFGLIGTYDHTTAAPQPLEAELQDRQAPAPFVQVAPESGDTLELGLEHGGKVHGRLTYFAKAERNLIDVLPINFHAVVAGGDNPSPIGIPTNAGELRSHGLELGLDSGSLSLNATYIRGFSSSASQFAYNALNVAAIAAGHLFPLGYVPDFSGAVSYHARLGSRLTVTPTLSYESGYPYGDGTMAWTFNAKHQPIQVPNDNHVNPGYNYAFLANPNLPYNPVTNPIVGTLGTPEGADPNTLRSHPQTLASVHVDASISRKVRLYFDVFNLFGVDTPTQLQVNPYLIGPPGYAGGNALYARWYGQQLAGPPYRPYTLGNGVPTRNGEQQILPWTYGTAGYVPSSYPIARSLAIGVKYDL